MTSSTTPECAEELTELGNLRERKLYHELTDALRAFVGAPARASSGRLLLDLNEKFLGTFEARLNQLAYAQIFAAIVRSSVDAARVLTADEAIAMLGAAVEAKRERLGTEPALYLEMEAALLRLTAPRADAAAAAAVHASVKKALDEAKPTMDALTGTTDTAVFHKRARGVPENDERRAPVSDDDFTNIR